MSALGTDLSAIRQQKDLSVEDIHDATRIPVETIKQIEDDSIFGDPTQNITYVRSFVRTYGKALKIDDEDMVDALDKTFTKSYRGGIFTKYGHGAKPSMSSSATSAFSEKKKDEDRSRTSESSEEKPKSTDTKASDKDKSTTDYKSGPKVPETAPEVVTSKAKEAYNKAAPPPNVSTINWADTGKKIYEFKNRKVIIAGVIAALLLVVVLGYFWLGSSDPELPEPVTQNETPPSNQDGILPDSPIDTSMVAGVSADSVDGIADEVTTAPDVDESTVANTTSDAQNNGILSDTLELIIYAANGKLEPVRVKSDIVNEYSPYWIEQGVGMQFKFTDSIYVRGQYTRMELLLNGRYIDGFRTMRAPNREILLTRSIFEDEPTIWQRTDNLQLPASITVPDTVIKRPTFN